VNWFYYHVLIDLHHLERRSPSYAVRFREQWDALRAERGSRRLRAAACWLGDRLVAAGERLRAWSAAGTAMRTSAP
jgi:hypothetical protein